MKKIIIVVISIASISCSFKSSDQKNGNESAISVLQELKLDPNGDSDGDGILNKDEVERGSDPLVADVPELDSKFIQNFLINVAYNKVNDNKAQFLSLSSKLKDTDSSFKYSVGKLFGVENSMNFAAQAGRFTGHSYGEIKNEDFTWVKYPELDPLVLHSDVIKYRPIIDGQDSTGSKFENYEIKVTLDCSVKLTGVKFKEIKDLSVNFYYHDYEKDTYVLLKNITINRTFQRKVNEKFSVEIENVPISFLRDTYFKHGEFLVSEIDNYYIPELDKDFKTLMAGVKAKTIPVLLTSPSENEVYFVASGSKGISFLEVLNRIFAKNYVVENNVLKKIGQYENNLGSFEHLIDLKDKDKVGNWFVLTNKFKEHFMDHLFTPVDQIALTYINGSDLSSRPEAVQNLYNSNIASVINNETVIPLGLISPNSKIELAIKGESRFGHEAISTPYSGSWSLGGGGNGSVLNYSCQWIGNKRAEFNRKFDLTINYNEEWENLYLLINEEKFQLSKLITEKKVTVRNLEFNYLITIDDIAKIKALKQSDENKISLSLISTITKKHQGIKLTAQGGNQNSPWCTAGPGNLTTIGLANSQFGGEVSKGSVDSGIIEKEIVNTQMYPNNTGASSILSLKLMDDIDYEQNFSLAISSRITNYFN
jgi:hypothetical protein